MSFDNYMYYDLYNELSVDARKIALPVLLGFIILGIPINLIAFCIWVFGPKSKTLCCATYFALNAVADFLCYTIPGIVLYTDWLCDMNFFNIRQCFAVKTVYLLYTHSILLALSNWISASITIERAFTILWPFVFKPQDMQKRSKYVVSGICVLIVSTFVPLQYFDSYIKFETEQFDIALRIVLPFTLIVTMNIAVVATLCRRKFQQSTRSTNQTRFVEIFTKITLLTGLAFVLSNAIGVILFMFDMFGIQLNNNNTSSYLIHFLGESMYFFNGLSNPVISFIVCKSVREDLWSFVCMIARKCRNTCQCRRPNQVPDPVHVELVVTGEDTSVMLSL